MTTSTLDEKGVSMTAGPRRGLKLSQIKAQGTALGAVDLPEEFRTWALANNFPTAEAVYGFFYAKSDEKDRLLKSLGMNYNRLFDRLCKAIPSDKLAQLNRLAGEEYQIGEM
ncbi:MAG: hypothetical protein KGS72_28720 [Cyanobacteria bacterium REEB67]|nr:hypothetical protein [Cyanobacteria bacterium REEB67]